MADTHDDKNQGKRPNPIQMQKYLKGASYPAGKADLVQKAQANNAPAAVVQMLQSLASDHFGSPADVMKAVGKKE